MSVFGKIGFTILALGLWFLSQRFLGKRIPHTDKEIKDVLHDLTANINSQLRGNTGLANVLLITSSLIVDLLGVFIIVWSIFGPSMRPLVGLFVLFFLRQINQAITALPVPKGMIWRDPGFPSLFVTYGVSTDLFFSGHTALATFGALELMSLGNIALSILGGLFLIYEVMVVILLRAHWTLDVFAGAVTALLIFELMPRLGSYLGL